MNEPKRWLDEPGDVPEELSVLLAKAHKAPPAMGPLAKSATAVAVAKIGAGGLVLSGAAKSVIAVVLAGTIGTTAYVATRETGGTSGKTRTGTQARAATSTKAVDVAVPSATRTERDVSSAHAPVVPAPQVVAIEAVQAGGVPPGRASRPRSNPSPREADRIAPSVEPSTATVEVAEAPSHQVAPIVEEARVLEGARRLLEADPVRALSITDDHARRFPEGALSEERELLAVDALLRTGRINAARERAAAAIAAHPRGVQTARIRSLIENFRAP